MCFLNPSARTCALGSIRLLKMENFWKVILCLIVIMMGIFCAQCRDPVLHRVGGGRYTWAPNINFEDWSSHEQFFVGDWLYFGFDKHVYNVLEVNKTSYEKCIDKGFIKNITRGGRDVFNLTEARPYYFLSGRGYCFKGMKVEILVRDYQAPPTVPIVVHKTSAADISGNNIQPVLIATALVWTFLFK
ncbi:hypothetical protein CMV_016576 [Castanea mollissima]|uniref:Phytocyanin domain-containing protein n=1 Tax=Castanea mollissima TaxID=60419 RepID=A0A8J4QU98_9ROSI|nr:hypothetical protein CMV_016576 [Castanea mollissima]